MSDLGTTLGPDRVELELDEASFPRDAVYAAAFTFIDRCWVRLSRAGAGRLSVVLRAKSSGTPASFDAEALAAELGNQLLGEAFLRRLVDEGRPFTDAVFRSAFGFDDGGLPRPEGALPPAKPLGDDGEPDVGMGAGFDDPLGIAASQAVKRGPDGVEGT